MGRTVVELILVVDDEHVVRQLLSAILEVDGYDVIVAMNRQEAEYAVEHRHPHAVVLDLRLPSQMDGFALLDKYAKDVPIIVLTGLDEAAAEERVLLAHGARAVLRKPFSVLTLLSIVKDALNPPTEASVSA